jgi:hypothetical protein
MAEWRWQLVNAENMDGSIVQFDEAELNILMFLGTDRRGPSTWFVSTAECVASHIPFVSNLAASRHSVFESCSAISPMIQAAHCFMHCE